MKAAGTEDGENVRRRHPVGSQEVHFKQICYSEREMQSN